MFWIFWPQGTWDLSPLTRMEPTPHPEGGVSTADWEPLSEPSFLSFRAHPASRNFPVASVTRCWGADSKFSLFPFQQWFRTTASSLWIRTTSTLDSVILLFEQKKQPRLRQRKDLQYNHLTSHRGTRKKRKLSLANAGLTQQ